VCNIVKAHLHKKFPRETVVEIDLPDPQWAIQHIVFSANGVMAYWNFDEYAVEQALPDLLAALDDYVERYAEACRGRGSNQRPAARTR
jgi:uncharacterized Rmd1/YagE family protein